MNLIYRREIFLKIFFYTFGDLKRRFFYKKISYNRHNFLIKFVPCFIYPTYIPHLSHIYPTYIPHLSHIYPTFIPHYPTFIPHLSHIYPTYIPHLSHIYPTYIPHISHIISYIYPTFYPHIISSHSSHILSSHSISHYIPLYNSISRPGLKPQPWRPKRRA